MDRRDALRLLGALPIAACTRMETRTMESTNPERSAVGRGRMPVIFFAAHGAPLLLDDPGWMNELARWANAMPRPRNSSRCPRTTRASSSRSAARSRE
jgi:hypothetical protein